MSVRPPDKQRNQPHTNQHVNPHVHQRHQPPDGHSDTAADGDDDDRVSPSGAAANRPGTSALGGPGQRLDKWLWAARFYKTRSLAADEIGKGRISVNGQVAKPSRELRVGDRVTIRQGPVQREVGVLGLSAVRGPAPVAQTLYAETEASVRARQQAAEARRLAAEPALAIAQGRPTKRDRRDLQRTQVSWQRWSASVDDAPD